MSKICIRFILLALALCFMLGGCNWVGRTTGKAQAKIERKAGDVEQGYHDGYTQEKAKTK